MGWPFIRIDRRPGAENGDPGPRCIFHPRFFRPRPPTPQKWTFGPWASSHTNFFPTANFPLLRIITRSFDGIFVIWNPITEESILASKRRNFWNNVWKRMRRKEDQPKSCWKIVNGLRANKEFKTKVNYESVNISFN